MRLEQTPAAARAGDPLGNNRTHTQAHYTLTVPAMNVYPQVFSALLARLLSSWSSSFSHLSVPLHPLTCPLSFFYSSSHPPITWLLPKFLCLSFSISFSLTPSYLLSLATSTLKGFSLKTHNFCYVYACRPYYSGVFEPLTWRFSNAAGPVSV